MFSYLLVGAAFGFSAAAQPGPFQAYLVSSTMTHGWRKTMPAVFAPIASDIPIAGLVLLALTRVPPAWLEMLRVVGGLFLLYLAARAFAAYRRYRHEEPARSRAAARTFLEAITVNLLNPNPYISWSLVLGPLLIRAWGEGTSHAVALVVSFYATFVAATSVVLLLLAGARSLGPRVGRLFVGLSAVALACFGAYQLWTAVQDRATGL